MSLQDREKFVSKLSSVARSLSKYSKSVTGERLAISIKFGNYIVNEDLRYMLGISLGQEAIYVQIETTKLLAYIMKFGQTQ